MIRLSNVGNHNHNSIAHNTHSYFKSVNELNFDISNKKKTNIGTYWFVEIFWRTLTSIEMMQISKLVLFDDKTRFCSGIETIIEVSHEKYLHLPAQHFNTFSTWTEPVIANVRLHIILEPASFIIKIWESVSVCSFFASLS